MSEKIVGVSSYFLLGENPLNEKRVKTFFVQPLDADVWMYIAYSTHGSGISMIFHGWAYNLKGAAQTARDRMVDWGYEKVTEEGGEFLNL